jgi:hypothetical protein
MHDPTLEVLSPTANFDGIKYAMRARPSNGLKAGATARMTVAGFVRLHPCLGVHVVRDCRKP